MSNENTLNNFELLIKITHKTDTSCDLSVETTVIPAEDPTSVEETTSATLAAYAIHSLVNDSEMLSKLVEHYTEKLSNDVSGQEDSKSTTP